MKVRSCFVALCLLIFYCSTAYSQTAEWEYKVVQINKIYPYYITDEFLNHFAKNGWELVTISDVKAILKRSRSHPLFGTKTPEMPASQPAPPPPQKPTCKLTLAQAPVIRGLRLGMTSDELFAIFPANEREEFDRDQQLKSAELPPNYGSTFFQFSPSNYAIKDRFTGIGALSFVLFDKKVVFIRAGYSNTPLFDSTGQLMEVITQQFGLPEFRDWPEAQDGRPSLSCDGFTFKVSAGNGNSGSFSIELTAPGYTKIIEDRKKAALAKKREGFKL
jgi:uncharacterized protein DUF4177